MEALQALQLECSTQINKLFTNYKKTPKDRLTKAFLETRYEMLEQFWIEFQARHVKLAESTAEAKATMSYFSENVYESCQDNYLDMKTRIKEQLNYNEEQRQLATKTQPETEEMVVVEQKPLLPIVTTKLPAIQLPTFSGDYKDWLSFHDLYTSLVHNNSAISKVNKCQYLKSSLRGDAESFVKQIQVSESNYDIIWAMLNKRYNNKRSIVNAYIGRLMNQKKITTESAKAIRELLDTTTECLATLKGLDLPTDSWNDLVVYTIIQKLDSESHKLFEQKIESNNKLPTWMELSEFLEYRFRTLEVIKSKESSSHPKNVPTTKSFATEYTSQQKCVYCNADHLIFRCKDFCQLDVSGRKEFVQKNFLCFNCLKRGHSSKVCTQSTSCKKCARKHNTLLHGYVPPPAESEPTLQTTAGRTEEIKSPSPAINTTENCAKNCPVLLATALVEVHSEKTGQVCTLRALVDQGSQASLITEAACQFLCLKRTPIRGNVSGIGANKAITRALVEFDVTSKYNTSSTRVNAYVLKNLTSYLPQHTHSIEWPQIRGFELADPNFQESGKIDLILGADVYADILQDGILTLKNENNTLLAQKTTLGWLISGKSSTNTPTQVHIHHVRVEIDTLLKSFWEIEENTEKRIMSNLETKCEKHYESTHKRLEDGRYQVRLPFITNPPDIGESLSQAISRQEYLQKKFKKVPELQQRYNEFMRDYLEQNHMETVPVDKENKKETVKSNEVCYLPHHAVVNEQHLTTKLRVVFDSSAKTSNDKSLNDNLMVGPPLQNDLRDVTLRWRRHGVVLVGDIQQMYRQILVDIRDRDFLRIVFKFDGEDIQHFRLTTVTYGTSCAPYLAIKTLRQLAEDERPNFEEEVIETVLHDFYIDDLLTGRSTSEKVNELKNELIKLLQKGGFLLHKWASNNPNVEGVKQDNRKILGLNWNSNTDKFELKIELPPLEKEVTKRSVLGDIAKIYDPAGWLAPVVIVAKAMLQKLWINNLEWDDPLPEPLMQEWLKFREELTRMPTIELNRWIGITEDIVRVEIHGFCDASMIAYSAIVYCRVITQDRVIVTVLEAKTRVAPVKQISLPRLELCGAVLLAKLMYRVQSALSIPTHDTYAWTDATIVLAWLQRSPSYWTTFVANRVTEITNLIQKERWYHVTSQENPADVASRGISPTELPDHDLWWNGPVWLHHMDSLPIHCKDEMIDSTEVEKKLSASVSVHSGVVSCEKRAISNDQCSKFEICDKYSKFSKVIRVMAYILRFISCLKHRINGKSSCTYLKYLTTKELQISVQTVVKMSQRAHFEKEIYIIRKYVDGKNKYIALKKLENGSKIVKLNPYIDDHDVIRVGGRIGFSDESHDVKHPTILSKDCKLSHLIVKDAHYKTLHGGIQLMLNFIRTKFHIIGVKHLVKNVIHKCVSCCKHSGKTSTQMMGNLPKDRVTPQRPFKVSGVDFAGPITLKLFSGRGSNKTQKGYIAVFICTSVKAVHLELVTSLSSEGFLSAFRRFTARRGHCGKLISDCGSNFCGASKDLKVLFNMSTSPLPVEIADLLAQDGTDWQFNPAGAPHMGGIWEAAVKSAKHHINRVLNDTKLTYEEYSTLLCQIESCLNSRPLTPLSNDSEGVVTALTPGHFLIGEAHIVVPDQNLENVNVPYLHRWVYLQQKLQSFWKRWSQEYLVELQKRHKWTSVQDNVDIGTVVLIKDERLPPAKWLLGKIVDTHPGADGLIRVVSIKCKNTVIKRPVHKLCILPTDG